MTFRKFLFCLLIGFCLNTNSEAALRMGDKTAYAMFFNEATATFVSKVGTGNYAEAEKLLKTGLDINATGQDGITPLLWVMGTTPNVHKIEFMLENGANPNYRVEKDGYSAVYLAAGGDKPGILELLLKHGADPNLMGPGGDNMLMIAVGQFRDKNLELLMRYGADINRTNHLKQTVANTAIALGRFDLVIRFLDLGLNDDWQKLARLVEIRQIPQDSEQQRWKNIVLKMLEEKGAKLPAFTPCYPRTDPRRIEANCK